MQLEQEVHLVAVCKSMFKAMRSMQALAAWGWENREDREVEEMEEECGRR